MLKLAVPSIGHRMVGMGLSLAAAGLGCLRAEEAPPSGEAIYERLCIECHGKNGEGVPKKHEEPLYGERSVEALARLIERTMPDGAPEKCVGEEAQKVAAYIYNAFYSPAAQARLHPARRAPARLTNRQFRESVADLIGSFGPPPPRPGVGVGLAAQYFQSDGMNKKAKRGPEREDRAVDFDFGEGSPAEGIAADQYSIAWQGSLLVEETGWHEFRLRTPNGARLYLNSELREGDGNRRDDSAAGRQPALIDAWVSSGDTVREETARVFLLGGRSYSLRLDYFKFKDKRGSIRMEWKPPHGVWSVLAAPYLSPAPAARVAVVSASFPPDDASVGYERGTAVSKAWHEAATKASVEAANEVVARLRSLSKTANDAPDRVEQLQRFVATLAERAFRRPLTEEARQLYVGRAFAGGVAPDLAVKRAVMLVLTSPRFLYPELGAATDEFTVASRLALGLWDSLPDAALIEAAGRGELCDPAQVRAQAQRMMQDPRAKAKLGQFFHRWLALEEAQELNKDATAYPGFDESLVGDLRRSLDSFVDHVVWSDASDYRELLLADYVFLNPRLAQFYGMPAPGDPDFLPVKFDPAQRAGIFTHPFLLSAFSYHKTSSPIHRGVFITRHVLGRFLKPPPIAVAFVEEEFDPSLTMREKVTELTSKSTCISCHATINPLGFSLENYDAVGRFRTLDNNKPVNAESDYTTLEGEVVRLRGPRDLAMHTSVNEDARRGFVRQLFQYAIKQPTAAYGPEALEKLDDAFDASGYHIRNLFVEINTLAARHGLESPKPASP